MTDTIMLVGSLSNDLFRVANLSFRGSDKAAMKFLNEAKRWAEPLKDESVAPYITRIAEEIAQRHENDISIELAEKYLMYGTLLQNYALHKLNIKSHYE